MERKSLWMEAHPLMRVGTIIAAAAVAAMLLVMPFAIFTKYHPQRLFYMDICLGIAWVAAVGICVLALGLIIDMTK